MRCARAFRSVACPLGVYFSPRATGGDATGHWQYDAHLPTLFGQRAPEARSAMLNPRFATVLYMNLDLTLFSSKLSLKQGCSPERVDSCFCRR